MNSVQNAAHQPSSGDFFPCLDGLRGFAVLSVVLFHTVYFNPSNPIQNLLLCLTKAGWMGVPIFFVLSGFLISHAVFKSPDSFSAYSYTLRRIGKIAPPFILSLIIFSAFSYCFDHTDNLIQSALAFATTLAHFQQGWACINGVYWSLMIEIHFYIVLPLLYFGLKRISKHPEWLTLCVFTVVPALIRLTSHLPASASKVDWNFHANLFPRAFDNFSLGMLFSIVFIRYRFRPDILKFASLLASLGFLLMIFTYLCYAFLQWRFSIFDRNSVFAFEAFRYLPAIATFLLLFVVFTPPTHALHRVLNASALSFIGLVSYEWFLFHQPPAQFFARIIGEAHGNTAIYLLKTLVPLVLSFGFSVLLYFYFSAPILSRIKAYLKNRYKIRKQEALVDAAESSPAGI